jgi:anaerobic selenocysteine-containing dehydrogenase
MYMAATNVVIGWTMGITHHLHGVENVQMIANLALLRGMIGRPSAGLLPIRDTATCRVWVCRRDAVSQEDNPGRLEQRLGIRGSDAPGLDTMACIEACGRGTMDVALCLGGNLFGSNPDAAFASEALGKLELIAYMSTSLNSGHAWGTARETLVLPVLPRDEESQRRRRSRCSATCGRATAARHAIRDLAAKYPCCPLSAGQCWVRMAG